MTVNLVLDKMCLQHLKDSQVVLLQAAQSSALSLRVVAVSSQASKALFSHL